MRSILAGFFDEVLIHIGVGLLLLAVLIVYGAYLIAAIVGLFAVIVYTIACTLVRGANKIADAVGKSMQNLRF